MILLSQFNMLMNLLHRLKIADFFEWIIVGILHMFRTLKLLHPTF